jgi:hypothetical protein
MPIIENAIIFWFFLQQVISALHSCQKQIINVALGILHDCMESLLNRLYLPSSAI